MSVLEDLESLLNRPPGFETQRELGANTATGTRRKERRPFCSSFPAHPETCRQLPPRALSHPGVLRSRGPRSSNRPPGPHRASQRLRRPKLLNAVASLKLPLPPLGEGGGGVGAPHKKTTPPPPHQATPRPSPVPP